jgi:hypothetical protein
MNQSGLRISKKGVAALAALAVAVAAPAAALAASSSSSSSSDARSVVHVAVLKGGTVVVSGYDGGAALAP